MIKSLRRSLIFAFCILTIAPLSQATRSAASPQGSAQNQKKELRNGDLYDLEEMSSMGRLAHLAATGRLDKAIAKARGRAKNGKAVIADAPDAKGIQIEEDTEDDLEDGPAGGQAETSLAVDSTGNHIVIGFNDTRGFSLNPLSVSGLMYSDDGGMTFVDGGQLPVTVPTSTIGSTIYPLVVGDPEVKYLGGSTFIYLSIMVKTISATGVAQTMGVHRSTDFGHTWAGPFEISSATNPHGLLSGANARDAADKEFADVDPDTGRVMMSWSNFTSTTFAPRGIEISTTFSDDVGTATPPTWSARQIVGNTIADGQGSIPRFAAGSSNVYVAWSRFISGTLNNNIGFAVSNDNGVSWSAPLSLTSDFFTMDQVLGNDRVHNFPSLAVDRSGQSTRKNIYVVYANNNNKDGADIAFQRSLNGGTTFSAPVLLNSRPGQDRAQWFPWVTVDTNTGRVYVFYYDQGSGAGDLTGAYYQFSSDGGLTWSTPANLINRPFRAGLGNDTGQPNLGDYNQAVAQNGELFATFAATNNVLFTDGLPSGSMTVPDVFFQRTPEASYKVPIRPGGAVTITDSGGNGVIDPGEQVRLRGPLQHYVTNPFLAPATLTGITGIRSTSTPGVTMVQGISSYPTLAPGATSSNDVDFIVQLSSLFVPGIPIQFRLDITTNQGNTTLQLLLQATGTASLTTFYSENFNAAAVGSLPPGWTTFHQGGNNTVPWTTSNTFGGTGSNGAFHRMPMTGPVQTTRALNASSAPWFSCHPLRLT